MTFICHAYKRVSLNIYDVCTQVSSAIEWRNIRGEFIFFFGEGIKWFIFQTSKGIEPQPLTPTHTLDPFLDFYLAFTFKYREVQLSSVHNQIVLLGLGLAQNRSESHYLNKWDDCSSEVNTKTIRTTTAGVAR